MLPESVSSNALTQCEELQTDSSVTVINIPMEVRQSSTNGDVSTDSYRQRNSDGTLRASYFDNNNSRRSNGTRLVNNNNSQSLSSHPKKELLDACDLLYKNPSVKVEKTEQPKNDSKKRKVIHSHLDFSNVSGIDSPRNQPPRKSSGYSHRISKTWQSLEDFVRRFINFFLFILYNIYLIYSIVKTWHKV